MNANNYLRNLYLKFLFIPTLYIITFCTGISQHNSSIHIDGGLGFDIGRKFGSGIGGSISFNHREIIHDYVQLGFSLTYYSSENRYSKTYLKVLPIKFASEFYFTNEERFLRPYVGVETGLYFTDYKTKNSSVAKGGYFFGVTPTVGLKFQIRRFLMGFIFKYNVVIEPQQSPIMFLENAYLIGFKF